MAWAKHPSRASTSLEHGNNDNIHHGRQSDVACASIVQRNRTVCRSRVIAKPRQLLEQLWQQQKSPGARRREQLSEQGRVSRSFQEYRHCVQVLPPRPSKSRVLGWSMSDKKEHVRTRHFTRGRTRLINCIFEDRDLANSGQPIDSDTIRSKL